MAKRYFVTEKTAGWLHEQMAARPGMATAGATRVDGRMGRDENGYPYPFEVCWSEAEGEWLIWLPAGIITSDHGYEDQLLGTLSGSSEYGSGWYVLNVSAESSWTPVYLDCWGAKYDSSATSPIEYHAELVTSLEPHERLVERYVVRVADLKSESSNGAKKVKQIAVGALVIADGGGSSTPGLFEPVFEGGVLSSVGDGIFPVGRQFLAGATLDESAHVATGLIGLEISHGYGTHAAVIKKISDAFGEVRNADTTKTVLPLYMIENGAIRIDCRALLALAMRE